MSLNLLDLVKDQVTSQLAGQASSFLGESESGVAKALGGLMPALLGGAISKASTDEGANGIMDMIGKMGNVGDVASIFGGGPSAVNGLMNSGGGIVESLLGSKSSGIIDFISNMAGIKSGSSSSLLKMAAPFLMSVIGKQVAGKGVGFLKDMILGQKTHVANAMPAGLGSVLGFADMLGGGADKLKSTVSSAANTASSTVKTVGNNIPSGNDGGGMGWLKWLLPLLLIGGLAYYLSQNGCGKKVEETVATTTEEVTSAVDTSLAAAGSVVDSIGGFMKKLASGFELKGASATGIESQLISFVEDANSAISKEKWFNFDRLLFDTGKATLQASSQEQLVNVAETLKAFPNVKIKLGGYTDNTGDPKSNKQLSTDRAITVLNELVKLGIDKSRLAAEGYGDQFPVGDNNTEEGRQQNRRIAVNVTAK